MLFLFPACSRKRNPVTDAITNRDSVPMMVTREVSTYVSDSGVVRYKIIADEWKVFDRLDPSRWTFEEGVYLEKYDNKLNVEATIIADTAYYYDKQELWELRGNVHIENIEDEQFDTQLLFWNQKSKEVYSDQYIRIRQQKRIITGMGFTSNQDFTKYTIKQTQGIFPIKEEQPATDSTTVAVEDNSQNEKQRTTDTPQHSAPKQSSLAERESNTQPLLQPQPVNEPHPTVDDKQDAKNVKRLKASDNVKTLKIIDKQLPLDTP